MTEALAEVGRSELVGRSEEMRAGRRQSGTVRGWGSVFEELLPLGGLCHGALVVDAALGRKANCGGGPWGQPGSSASLSP